MQTYATAVLYAIPFFLALIGLEWWAARRRGLSVMRSTDTLASLSSGTTNTLKTVLGLSVAIVSYDWMVDHLALYRVEATWAAVVIVFVVKDFAGYWNHRLNHEVNVFWNRHLVHHSSEEYNLACALRQSISELWVFFALFMLPAALLGVPTEVVAIVAPLHLFAQFWYHTQVIDKLWAPLEYIFVTPSHHRVHHAINDQYLDRNYSEVFIIWDRLFGTFQPELDEVTPVYGIKKAVATYNPFFINYQHLWRLAQDAWRTESYRDKARIWFKRTGWRPADVAQRYPYDGVLGGDAVFTQVKYDPRPPRWVMVWAWTQFVVVQLCIVHLFTQIGTIDWGPMMTYGGWLFLSVFALTSLLDGSRYAVVAEAVRLVVAAAAVWMFGGWFGAEAYFGGVAWVVLGYCLVSLGVSAYSVFVTESWAFAKTSAAAAHVNDVRAEEPELVLT